MPTRIPEIDAAPLFGPPGAARDAADRAILAAAADAGFMTIANLPRTIPVDARTRRALLAVLDVAPEIQRRLHRRKFAPANPNVYRGWFPLQSGEVTFKEGIDIGPDLVDPRAVRDDDPLCEATPLPSEVEAPGWRDVASGYFRGMAATGAAVMAGIGRGLGLPEASFADAFAGGISTLRLIRYPARSPDELATNTAPGLWVEHDGRRRAVSGQAHVDSGLVTLLAQDGVAGLQARGRDGAWVDVPPRADSLAVNFGKVLELWTGGRIRATEHRVLASDVVRCSIPFFFEPRVDARIARLPGLDGPAFAPFLYGDHLWSLMTKFVEFRGLEHLRPPRGTA